MYVCIEKSAVRKNTNFTTRFSMRPHIHTRTHKIFDLKNIYFAHIHARVHCYFLLLSPLSSKLKFQRSSSSRQEKGHVKTLKKRGSCPAKKRISEISVYFIGHIYIKAVPRDTGCPRTDDVCMPLNGQWL